MPANVLSLSFATYDLILPTLLASGDGHTGAINLVRDLAMVMAIAGLVTVIFHRLRQPVVLGYIIAGVIIGPHTPPFLLVHDQQAIRILSEIGVILLMFSLGLHFSFRKLLSVGLTALLGAIIEIVLMVWIGYEIGRLFGWSGLDSLFLGAILSISSTTIIVKALSDLGMRDHPFARIVFGILIVEDILAIAMIALLSSLAMTGELAIGDVVYTLGRLGVFLCAVMVFGLLLVPLILRRVARIGSNETLLVATLGLCFGLSILAQMLGYSVALGAFIIGAIIAETPECGRIEGVIDPVKDMFSAVFFVAVGMMIDPRLIAEYWLPITVITIAVIVGKVIACTFGTLAAGNDARTSLRVGMGLAQIGEFSFIIAQLGLTLNKTSQFLYPIAVTVSALTTLATPYLIRSSDGAVNLFERRAPRALIIALEVYSTWVNRIRAAPGSSNPVRVIVRRSMLQIALNVALIVAIFAIAGYMAEHAMMAGAKELIGEIWFKAVAWLTTMFVVMPILIVTMRKVRAMGMVAAEMGVPSAVASGHAVVIRAILVHFVFVTAVLLLALLVLVMSSTMLPPWPVAVIILAVLLGGAFLRRRTITQIYSRAQIALRDTLSTPMQDTDKSHH